MSFIKKNCSFKISSLFGGYLWIYPVNIIEQPHGSDQCGYIHLLYRFIFWFTVVEVGDLCRLGCRTIHAYSSCYNGGQWVLYFLSASDLRDYISGNVKKWIIHKWQPNMIWKLALYSIKMMRFSSVQFEKPSISGKNFLDSLMSHLWLGTLPVNGCI